MRHFRLLVVFLALLVIAAGVQAATWKVPKDFATIQEAVDDASVEDGDTIRVSSGRWAGALMTKAVIIKGKGRTIIDDGPAHPSGLSQGFRFLAGSDGAVLDRLIFETDLSIMNGDGVDDVIVTQCTFLNSIQAVSNWRGSGWDVTHNKIVDLRTRCGGGIGVLVADFSGGLVEDNVIEHNTISGTLHVDPNDCGGYSGSGIVIFADYRFGRIGADAITNNWTVHNKVAMTSDTPSVVDIVAFELTDTRNDANEGCNVVFDNSIGFNDWRRTSNQMSLTPANLDGCNNISRNLGNNRGHGLHPSVFQPN